MVITGASRGLGRGMAEAMAQRGLRLGLCARSDCALEGAVSRSVDVTDEAAVRAFADDVVAAFGRIDLWINNAGVLDPVSFVRDVSTEALMQHLAINVAGVMHGAKAFTDHVRSRDGEGVLINISSGAALKGYAGWGPYCAGKAALDRLSECIDLEEERVRVHAVAPGVIDTDMQHKIRGMTKEQFPMVDKFLQLAKDDAFSTPPYVADKLLDIAFSEDARPGSVVLRLPPQPK